MLDISFIAIAALLLVVAWAALQIACRRDNSPDAGERLEASLSAATAVLGPLPPTASGTVGIPAADRKGR